MLVTTDIKINKVGCDREAGGENLQGSVWKKGIVPY